MHDSRAYASIFTAGITYERRGQSQRFIYDQNPHQNSAAKLHEFRTHIVLTANIRQTDRQTGNVVPRTVKAWIGVETMHLTLVIVTVATTHLAQKNLLLWFSKWQI